MDESVAQHLDNLIKKNINEAINKEVQDVIEKVNKLKQVAIYSCQN